MSAEIISLSSLQRLSRSASGPRAGSSCGGGGGGCGSGTSGGGIASFSGTTNPPPPPGMDAAVWEKVRDHPCYSEDAHHDFARIHVAVAPACNIGCNYCNRKYDCVNESRPGVVSEKLTPEQALRRVKAAAAKLPQLSVVGIAGPGDAFANPAATFRTCELVARDLPQLKLCLSSNGLAVPEHVPTLTEFAVDHVTLTINMVDPEVGEQIYAWVFHNHRRWTGREASRILHERQMEALEALTAAGILVKVNTVLIPGINDQHLDDVHAAVKARGAFLHNIMPLISDPAHGTAFGLAGVRGPTPEELLAAQERLGGTGMRLMRHCRQCRADAVGLLGEDLEASFRVEDIPEEVTVDRDAHDRYRDVIAAEQAQRHEIRTAAERLVAQAATRPGGAGAPGRERLTVAVASRGGDRINQHFGHAREFLVYEVGAAGIRLLGLRRVDNYCHGGAGDDDNLEGIIAALTGVDLVLAARIGDCPRERLAAAGLPVSDLYAYDYIERALAACYAGALQAALAG